MVGKVSIFLCLQAVLLQSISGQNCGRCACSEFNGFCKTATYSTGGPVTVTCAGPLSNSGVSLVSDLLMEGQVEIAGCMPFQSAVALEGILPTSGAGFVDYGCGDNIQIIEELGNQARGGCICQY